MARFAPFKATHRTFPGIGLQASQNLLVD